MTRKRSNVRQVDGKGRVTLVSGFANCTVVIDQPDADTVVVRRATVIPTRNGQIVSVSDPGLVGLFAVPPAPENMIRLSPADSEKFEDVMANPPKTKRAIKRLMKPPKKK